MRICQFAERRLGLVEGDYILEVTQALDLLPRSSYPYPAHDVFIEQLPTLREALTSIAASATPLPLASVELRSPIANPGKIIAAPVNYRLHLAEVQADPELHHHQRILEIQRAGVFLKATSSLIGPGSVVVIGHLGRRTDHEIELVAVIGRRGRDIPRQHALEFVAGYTIGLDITLRGPEERSLRKSLDTYSVVGPWMVTSDELRNSNGLELSLYVNGARRQHANTRDLLLDVPALIEFASSFYELRPGDLIYTGTPEGVGPIAPGDRLLARIDGIGEMNVRIADAYSGSAQ